jgi:uncharacterized protein YjaG (DUF416 family)
MNLDTPDPKYEKTYRLSPDLSKLRDILSPLPVLHRLAFAVCCCERLYSGYQLHAAFLKTPDHLRQVLDRLWKHVLGKEMTEAEVEQGLATCMSIPLGEAGSCGHVDDAEDAVGAAYVTLDACRRYALDNVVRAAELARNKIDRPLWKRMAQEFKGGVGPEQHRRIRDAIRSHPAMVAEIEKEATQLRFLYECEELTESVIAQLLSL